jgi:hypothetical protein
MKKEIWLIIILGIIIIVLAGISLWPASKPTNNKPPVVLDLQIISPKANEEIPFPIKITGVVNGNGWSGFEGQVGTVELKKGNLILARAILQATSEWTSLPTNFQATISELLINCEGSSSCVVAGPMDLIFHNENPSGDPARDKTLTLPVKIK